MKDIIVQVLPQVIYYLIMALVAFIAVEWKKYNAKVLALKAQAEETAKNTLGLANYTKDRQLVVDSVYKAEQLAKEQALDGLTKHSLVSEWVADKTGLSEDQIFSIIKATVGLINSKK